MAAPHRANTGSGTYFITACAFQKQQLLQSERMARPFLEVLLNYRSQDKYLLHEFVLMPDHFHLLITPLSTLERALQLIKGGYSFRAHKELGFQGEIWEKSFHDSPGPRLVGILRIPPVHSSKSSEEMSGLHS